MHNRWPYFISISIIILFCACQNEESLIGNSFLNNGEYNLEQYTGTIHFSSRSLVDDSVSAASPRSLLGSYLDPIFGQTDASFAFQIKLPANNMSFNAQSIQDIYINIPYLDFYGHTDTDPNNIEYLITISQLTENIEQLSDLYINNLETDFSANFITSVTKNLADIQSSNSLQINLTESGFGLNEILNLEEEYLENNEAFLSVFNGFKLEVNPIQSHNGGIMYLESVSDSAFLHIEYINNKGSVDTINFEMGSQKRFNHSIHDYNNTSILSDSTMISLQAMGGTFCDFEIIGINNLKDQQYVAANSAELKIPIHEENGNFPLPESLILLHEGTNYSETSVGYLDSLNNQYKFNLQSIVERIMTEEDSALFKLYPTLNNATANRVVLSNNDADPIKLDLFLIKETD